MKDYLCFKKYKNIIIIYCVLLIASVILSLLLGIVSITGYLGLIICVVGFGAYIAYYTYAYFSYIKKTVGIQASIGIISNWNISSRRSRWGSVVLQHNGKEYFSPSYFGIYEAQEMVGKQVSYVIIEETLLIYEILD